MSATSKKKTQKDITALIRSYMTTVTSEDNKAAAKK